MGIDLPDRPRLRLREAVKFWQEGTPAVANAVPQRHQSHVNARDVTYFLPPPAIEFKEDTELDPNIIAMRKVVAAEKGRDLEFDVVRPDPAAVDAMYEFDCKLSEAAFAGKVKIFGRRDDQVSADEPIPVGYFVNPRGFCRDDGQIDPHPYPIDDAAMFRQAISHDRPIWHEVQVERAGYVAWLTVEYPSVAATLCDTAGGTTSRKTAATGKRLVTRAPPPPTRLTGGCTPPQTSKETSNPPEYRPSLSEMIEFNRARGECRGIIEMGRDLAGVNQIKWDYEAKRWADVVRPRLDQVITDRRKSGAPNEHLAMLARELAEFDAEFKLVCAYRMDASQPSSSAEAEESQPSSLAEAEEHHVGKVRALIEWLRTKFSGSPVPPPSHCPRKNLIAEAIKACPALLNNVDPKTMNKAIKAYNASLSNDRK